LVGFFVGLLLVGFLVGLVVRDALGVLVRLLNGVKVRFIVGSAFTGMAVIKSCSDH
jgi:hypothetical protein